MSTPDLSPSPSDVSTAPESPAESTADVVRSAHVRYVSNDQGEVTDALVPIAVWKEVVSELETQHLLSNPVMRERLLQALGREGGYAWEDLLDLLGLTEEDLEQINPEEA